MPSARPDGGSPAPERRLLLTLSGVVLFPGTVAAVELAGAANRRALAALGEEPCVAAPRHGTGRRLAVIGTLARVLTRIRLPNGATRAVLQGIERVRVDARPRAAGNGILVRVAPVASVASNGAHEAALEEGALERLLALLQGLAASDPRYGGELVGMVALNGRDPERLTDLAASLLPLGLEERIDLLEEVSPFRRVERLVQTLDIELVRAQVGRALEEKVAQRVRRGYLREKLETLRAELGEPDAHAVETQALEARLRDAPLPPLARRHALRELAELRRAAAGSPAAAGLRAWLEWLLELPWAEPASEPAARFHRVARVLERSHVGLADVKRRVAEFLAVRRLGGGARGTVLCFLGPPGTGKSTMGRAVAEALGRPFLAIPVGGMVHEHELVGISHRREAGHPGAILAGLHRCGAADPVILLDEIDKLRLGGDGSSCGALLQLLDPEHNAEFVDHHLGLPFDLSRCVFLATANDADEIPAALVDRMECIEFSGYAESEKVAIARRHLLPRARHHAGLEAGELRLSPAALRAIVRGYTEEAGVRQLQRVLMALARRAAVRVVRGGAGLSVRRDDLVELIGARTSDEDLRRTRPAVGVATGLAWTPAGGSLLPIEALAMPGAGRMVLTGQVGEVLRESVQTTVSHLRSAAKRLGFGAQALESLDLHLHFPSGATPKDGPSAGIAIATALASLLTGRAVRHDVAMTGELSLLGSVLPVGGLREKLLAAIRCGIREVIVPARNAEEVLQLSSEIKRRLSIHTVSEAAEVFDLALVRGPAREPALRASAVRQGRAARRARRGSRRSR